MQIMVVWIIDPWLYIKSEKGGAKLIFDKLVYAWQNSGFFFHRSFPGIKNFFLWPFSKICSFFLCYQLTKLTIFLWPFIEIYNIFPQSCDKISYFFSRQMSEKIWHFLWWNSRFFFHDCLIKFMISFFCNDFTKLAIFFTFD